MKKNLLFEFSVDKENKTIRIKREFDAEVALVWQAWTDPQFLVQWVAPKPWKAETKSMDFRKGGYWHYAMVGPNGEKHWSSYDYVEIDSLKKIVELRGFSDENGNIRPDFPRTICENVFEELDGNTFVSVTAEYGSLEVLEYVVSHGLKEGMSASLGNLDELLEQLQSK